MSDAVSEQELLQLLKKLDIHFLSRGYQELGLSPVLSHDHCMKTVDGYIKVEHGKIIVGNPVNGGKIPTIKAIAPIRLMVNGEETFVETKVSSESVIEWKIDEKPLFEITVSEDKIEAYLTIHRTQRFAWSLVDKVTTSSMILVAEEDPSIILESVSLQEIVAAIENKNIRMNIDIAAIQSEILQPTGKPVLIAKGKAPVQGWNAQLEIFFSENVENIFTEVSGLVDYKNHMRIPSVKNGDVIAKKAPPVEGQAGYDVFGNVLLPDPVKDIRIAGKNHVEIVQDSFVIARREGRPRVTGSQIKFFDINTSYVVPGNVDLLTGNIVFAGDVIVYGDVTDTMIIESLGNIYVAGSVFNATLTATGSIAVKGNVIGSNLYSGYFGMLYNRLYNSSKQLIDILEKMMGSAELLLDEIGKKNLQVRYGQVLALLMESKYRQIGDIVKELLSVISSIRSPDKDSLKQLQSYLEHFQQPIKIIEIMTVPRMEDFLRILKEALTRVALSQETDVQININQGQNSVLKSNGDILIRKEGIIQCDLYSARNIVFFLDNSVCRGCKLEAGDTISAMYVGGMTGVGTSLKAKSKIMVKKMFEGRVIVDRYSVDIFEPVEEKIFDRNNIRQMV